MREAIENAFPQVTTGGCLETITEIEFHIFDSSSDPKRCFIKRDDNDPIHFIVKNPENKEVHFLAIDKCIFNDQDASRCDFAVFNDTKFCFVEIKEPAFGQRQNARKKAKTQLTNTILEFRRRGILFHSHELEAIICIVGRKIKPSINAQQQDERLVFFEERGAILLEGDQTEF